MWHSQLYIGDPLYISICDKKFAEDSVAYSVYSIQAHVKLIHNNMYPTNSPEDEFLRHIQDMQHHSNVKKIELL